MCIKFAAVATNNKTGLSAYGDSRADTHLRRCEVRVDDALMASSANEQQAVVAADHDREIVQEEDPDEKEP